MKKVVEDLNGEIKITSNPKEQPGTEFKVTLNKHILGQKEIVAPNIVESRAITVDKLSPQETAYDANKQTILIVEDNVTMINYLLNKLRSKYNVYASLNGNDALKKLRSLPVLPDLIITDVMMDKVDGYAFAKIISNDPGYKHIPLIFLSAKSAKNDKLQALKLGAIDFIQKPFSVNELIQKIESILANLEKQRTAILNTVFNTKKITGGFQASKDFSERFEQNCEIYHLTTREKDIATLICQGYKYKDIGEALFIAERTVTKHAQNIFEKLQVSNKVELLNKLEA